MASITALSCGGGGGGGGHSSPVLEYVCSESAAAVDTVILLCETEVSRDVWRIDVVLGGPTTSTDIMGLAFDVVFEPADLTYVPGSAVLGTFLGQDGNTTLLAADIASNDPGRLIIGAHRANGTHGIQGIAAENFVLSFSLKANIATVFGPHLLHFENAEAVDHNGAAIGGIQFSDQLLLSVE